MRRGEVAPALGDGSRLLLRLAGERDVRRYLDGARHGRIDLPEEVDEAPVRFVDAQVILFVLAHGLVEERPGEPPAFVEEEVAQGVVAAGELAVDLADHLRERQPGEPREEAAFRLLMRGSVVRTEPAAEI